MIPRRIVLQNFRAIAEADIDLTTVTLAAIVGRNGAGKSSTFTLAPVFALFGDRLRGIAMDDLVRRGAQEMAVCFEFEHHGGIYQVIRTRSTKGKGKSTLELQKWVDDRWASESAEKIVDTEAKIRELINLDVETFTSSSMILQGRSNEFTAQPAGRRKEILQQILGLSIYEQLQVQARQHAAALNVKIEAGKVKLSELEERLKGLPDKQAALSETQLWLAGVGTAIKDLEENLHLQEEAIRAGEAKAARVSDLHLQAGSVKSEIGALAAEQADLHAKLERAEKILSHESEILSKSAELEVLRDEITSLAARETELDRLRQRMDQLDNAIRQGTARLREMEPRIAPLEKHLANREVLADKEAEYHTAAAELELMDKEAEHWRELDRQTEQFRTQGEMERIRLDNQEENLLNEIRILRTKAAMLADSNCIDPSIAACNFLADAQLARGLLKGKEAELVAIDRSQLEALENQIALSASEQAGIAFDPIKHRLLKTRVESLRQLADQAAQLDSKQELLDTLRGQLQDVEAALAADKAAKRNVEKEHAALSAALEPLPAKRSHAAMLQQWAVLKDQLAGNRQLVEVVKPRMEVVEAEIAAKQDMVARIEAEIAAAVLASLDHQKLVDELPAIKVALQEQRDQQNRLYATIGRLEGEIQALEHDQTELDRITTALRPLSDEWTRYQALIRAYGRDGIPALIIENAVPELERIANNILGQMSKGRHYVRFETQRELKSKDGVTETLDIIVGDWTAERPYETFSGGEQLRIDYAIRFALAELLARRAGSRVEWLTIDEGLGSQDAEHRALVLEAIKSVADRFKKVLVITHIEDAQAVFDQQIVMTNDGTRVEVTVA